MTTTPEEKDYIAQVIAEDEQARKPRNRRAGAEPVPPAGDVEVLKFNRHPIQWALIDANYCAKQNSPAANAYLLLDAKHDINILYAHVTRLTAERDGLLAELGQQKEISKAYIASDGERSLSEHALRAELTKAREFNADLMNRAADVVECLHGLELPGAGVTRLRKLLRVIEFHQSAPAAKGGE